MDSQGVLERSASDASADSGVLPIPKDSASPDDSNIASSRHLDVLKSPGPIVPDEVPLIPADAVESDAPCA